MKEIEIRYNPYRYRFAYYMDGEPVTSRSQDKSHVLSKQDMPFHSWVADILQALDMDLNEDYKLIFTGRNIEGEILKLYQVDSRFCKEIQTVPYSLAATTEERLKKLEMICGAEHLNEHISQNLPVYTDDMEMAKKMNVESCWPRSKMYQCTVTYHDIHDIFQAGGNFALVLLFHHSAHELKTQGLRFGRIYALGINEDQTELVRTSDSYCIDCVPRDSRDLIQFFIDYEALPYLLTVAVDQCKGTLQNAQHAEMLLEIDCLISVEPLPKNEKGTVVLEEGQSVTPVITCIPAEIERPEVWFESSNSNVIRVSGTTLTGIHQGNCRIIAREAGKTKPIYDEIVSCIYRNRIQDIRVAHDYVQAELGTIIPPDFTFYPIDADNTDMICIKSSNQNIVSVDVNDNLVARAIGTSDITIKAEGVSCTFQLDVLPAMQRYQLSQNKVRLLVGQEKEIQVNPSPQNAYFSPYTVHVVPEGIVEYDDVEGKIYALQAGQATIRFVEENGRTASNLDVRVHNESASAWIKVAVALAIGAVLIITVARYLF